MKSRDDVAQLRELGTKGPPSLVPVILPPDPPGEGTLPALAATESNTGIRIPSTTPPCFPPHLPRGAPDNSTMPRFIPACLPRVPKALLITLVLLAPLVWYFQSLLYTAWTLLLLPIGWSRNSSDFLISRAADNFDVTFAEYGVHDTSAGPEHPDRVPPILHHIMLGPASARDTWTDARKSCVELHPGWEARMWTDEEAEGLVADKFPGFKETWDSYELQIQKVDALRYLVLYEYGGKHEIKA